MHLECRLHAVEIARVVDDFGPPSSSIDSLAEFLHPAALAEIALIDPEDEKKVL